MVGLSLDRSTRTGADDEVLLPLGDSTAPKRRLLGHVCLAVALIAPYLWLDRSTWLGEKQIHTLMELASTNSALFVGAIAYIRFRANRRQLELFIAVGFVGTALLDGYHTVLTSIWFESIWPSPPSALIPWSWNASRTYLAIMLAIAIWSGTRTGDETGVRLSNKAVLAVSSWLCLATFIFFFFVPLPRAYYPELIFGRPEEFVAGLLFAYSLMMMIRSGNWRRDSFQRWLSLSLVIGVIGQMVYMSRSYQLFDVMFDTAHMLKTASYWAVLLGLLFSIDELYREESRVSSELELMALAVRDTADGIAMFDATWQIQYSNKAFQAQLDWALAQKQLVEHADPLLGSKNDAVTDMLELGATWTGRRSWPGPDGGLLDVEATISPVNDDGDDITGFVVVLRDISLQKVFEDELQTRANHDPLTGLPNRASLIGKLEDIVALRDPDKEPAAVLFLDLDNFKLINDSLGHAAGDELLIRIANRLRQVLRSDDVLGRLGGDEFLVLCNEVASEKEAMAVADRVLRAMGPSYPLSARTVHATMSIGVALTRPGESAGDLLAAADTAAYEAKSIGRDCAVLFDQTLRDRAREDLEVRNSLRESLDRGGELIPYYQPIVDVVNAKVIGFEALARWRHPERGLLTADAFIEIAEQSGLEVPMSWAIMSEVTQQIARWVADPELPDPTFTSVNVSARQLRDPGFVFEVNRRIEAAAIEPSLLCIEVTEHTLVADLDAAAKTLSKVREIGVKVAIDDFGIGNSSLSYLQSLPVDVVKIDRSFAQAMHEGVEAATIVTAVIRMTKALGHTVVVEGIETSEQMATLHTLRCDRAQGYLFSPAVPVHEATRLLGKVMSLTPMKVDS